MQQFIKNLIAAAILFVSLLSTLAFGYVITPENEVQKPAAVKTIVKLNIEDKKVRFNLNHAIKLLIPTVKN